MEHDRLSEVLPSSPRDDVALSVTLVGSRLGFGSEGLGMLQESIITPNIGCAYSASGGLKAEERSPMNAPSVPIVSAHMCKWRLPRSTMSYRHRQHNCVQLSSKHTHSVVSRRH